MGPERWRRGILDGICRERLIRCKLREIPTKFSQGGMCGAFFLLTTGACIILKILVFRILFLGMARISPINYELNELYRNEPV